MEDIRRLKSYLPKAGVVILVEAISQLLLICLLQGFRLLAGFLFLIIDRPAFTSGDLPYLLRSWQGILLIVIGLAILFVYVALDINVKVIMSEQLVNNRKVDLKYTFEQSFINLKKFLCPMGFLIILFVSFIAPLSGGLIGISLTSSFRVPDFILTVIHSKPILYILYWLFIIAMLIIGIVYVFSFHFINIAKMKPKAALINAAGMMKKNKAAFFGRIIPFFLLIMAGISVPLILFVVFPISALSTININNNIYRFLLLVFIFIGLLIILACVSLFNVAIVTELTLLFEEFRGRKIELTETRFPRKRLRRIAGGLLAIVLIASLVCTLNFDSFFPVYEDESRIIAHRGAGNLTDENTVESIMIAEAVGADASEIDIHRTKDGEYILNHDSNFERLTGDPRTPQEMTLEEIKQLRTIDGFEIATLDEIMDAAKDKVHLYIELKGVTADRQMVDDVYRKLVEKDMLDQCSMISLEYDVIEYAEETYPEVDTVYLLFFGFGKIENLKCDSLGLEQETATYRNIERVQQAGKRVDIWTCNTINGIISAIRNGADGIITDHPLGITLIKVAEMVFDSDLLRILNVIMPEI